MTAVNRFIRPLTHVRWPDYLLWRLIVLHFNVNTAKVWHLPSPNDPINHFTSGKLVEHAPISAPLAQKLVEHWLLRRHGSRAPVHNKKVFDSESSTEVPPTEKVYVTLPFNQWLSKPNQFVADCRKYLCKFWFKSLHRTSSYRVHNISLKYVHASWRFT